MERESPAETGESAVTAMGKGPRPVPPPVRRGPGGAQKRPPAPPQPSPEDGAGPALPPCARLPLAELDGGLTGLWGLNRAHALMPQLFPECPLRAQGPPALGTG